MTSYPVAGWASVKGEWHWWCRDKATACGAPGVRPDENHPRPYATAIPECGACAEVVKKLEVEAKALGFSLHYDSEMIPPPDHSRGWDDGL